MNKRQADRARALYHLLRRLPAKKLVMQTWGDATLEDEAPVCTTAGCVGGWLAALYPRLFLRDDDEGGTEWLLTTDELIDALGITWNEAEALFHQGFAKSPKQKAAEVEALMANYGWEPGA